MNVLHIDNNYLITKFGKIIKHDTKAKGKIYRKGKIYLKNDKFVGKKYYLIELDKIISQFKGKDIEHKGYLIVIKDS